MDAHRVKKLREMVDVLERLPASRERDRMLSEVRSRMVDVDTGVTPRAMLPLREPTPPRPKHDGASRVTRPVPVAEPPRTAPVAATPTNMEQSLWLHERLSLEDAPLPHARVHTAGGAPPWTLGLRG